MKSSVSSSTTLNTSLYTLRFALKMDSEPIHNHKNNEATGIPSDIEKGSGSPPGI